MSPSDWYGELAKPSWAPPAWIFSPVWTALYLVIGISFGYVLLLFLRKKIPFAVLLPFVLNLIFNLAFPPVQFVLQNNLLAAIDIILVLGTLVWALAAVYKYARWVAFANIPYLLWVMFASALQIAVTALNR